MRKCLALRWITASGSHWNIIQKRNETQTAAVNRDILVIHSPSLSVSPAQNPHTLLTQLSLKATPLSRLTANQRSSRNLDRIMLEVHKALYKLICNQSTSPPPFCCPCDLLALRDCILFSVLCFVFALVLLHKKTGDESVAEFRIFQQAKLHLYLNRLHAWHPCARHDNLWTSSGGSGEQHSLLPGVCNMNATQPFKSTPFKFKQLFTRGN